MKMAMILSLNILALLSPGNFEAPGYFEGRVSPGSQTKIVAPRRYKAVDLADIDKKLREGVITKEEAETLREQRLDPQSEDLIAAYAAVRGILMKQDGVGFHRPFYNKSLRKGDLNAVEIDIGRPFTKEETANFAQILSNISGHGEFNPIGSVNGVRLINFDYLSSYRRAKTMPTLTTEKSLTTALKRWSIPL
jgi:hypothetical protein